MESIDELHQKLRSFTQERGWEQFHSVKNLAMALAGEVGELNALLQWIEPEAVETWLDGPDNATALRLEIADVLAYLILLADAAGVDPVAAGLEKVAINERRYPLHLSRGSAAKYTELGNDR